MDKKRGSCVSNISVISDMFPGPYREEMTNRACVTIFCGVILTLTGSVLVLLTSLGFGTFVKYPVWSLVAWIVVTCLGILQITIGILLLKKETRLFGDHQGPDLSGLVTPIP